MAALWDEANLYLPLYGREGKMSNLKHGLLAAAALAASGLLVSACATEDYVNQQVGAVKSQVAELSGKVEGNSTQIQALNGQVQDASRSAQEAAATHVREQGLNHHVISSASSVNFETAKWDLSQEDQTELTDFARKLFADNQDVYVEIEGHGDSRGSEASNQALGLKRAEATRQFLASQGVPLHRMSVISYGEKQPIGANETTAGQAMNRRVVINVVSN
jgi:peptidoglycan-associated lipoprotein